ncbi:MAG: site-2 protease family protein [Flavobacteriales bacterium]|nr:site-2 protease family protein [Flavobacteriales bacterium]MCX7767438.1 site-2 protease family protein [Flavobacteriales bacterium]MDW8410048.1 site-2 protease family protein [Flavobacteriales bacterium]
MRVTNSSLEVLSVRGIPILIHWSFLLILGYVGYENYRQSQDFGQVLWALLFILSLFLCVTLHELGHALAALRYGIRTRSITLYPIGGVAMLEHMPEKPIQELVVALAGPAVNVVIAFMLGLWIVFSPVEYRLEDLALAVNSHNFILNLAFVNIFLVLFNLLPAFPMDGGRVLRALLATVIPRVHATRIAMFVGQAMAILFIFWGFKQNPFLIFIGFFIFFGAAQEYQMVRQSGYMINKPVASAMMTRFTLLSPQHSLQDVVDLILRGQEKEFVVVDEKGRPVGIITRDLLVKDLAQKDRSCPLAECMQPTSIYFRPHTNLDDAFRTLQKEGISIAPVISEGQIVGVINIENIMESILLVGEG